MMGFFTDPYPDEILYSTLARYARRVNYSSKQDISVDLFKVIGGAVSTTFQTRIGALVDQLPRNHRYTPEQLIWDHTILPLFSPFLEADGAQRLLDSMKGVPTGRPAQFKHIRWPYVLRYCPLCAESDRSQFGQAFWHRSHQVPFVSVCPIHRTRLVNTQINSKHRIYSQIPAVAEEVIPHHTQADNSVSEADAAIADDVAWLLSHPIAELGPSAFREGYFDLLVDAGYARYGKPLVRIGELVAALEAHPLSSMIADWEVKPRGVWRWVSSIVGSAATYEHPLYHIVLAHFLGTTMADLATRTPKSLFGQGPWPCLNKAVQHYLQPTICECVIREGRTSLRSEGVFRCEECGFTYVRVGPDSRSADRFRYDRVQEYGGDFVDLVRSLRADKTSDSEISLELGIHRRTVARVANGTKGPSAPWTRASRRSAFEKLVASWPLAMREDLRRRNPSLYAWLMKHDRAWLEGELPHAKPQYRSKHGKFAAKTKNPTRVPTPLPEDTTRSAG